MITTTVASLITIKPILQQLANVEMAAKDSFAVLRVLKVIEKEYESIETTQRKLIDAYGEKNEDGNYKFDDNGGIVIKKDDIQVFTNEMEGLLKTEVALDIKPIKLSILDKMELTPSQLWKMEEFIDAEEDGDKSVAE